MLQLKFQLAEMQSKGYSPLRVVFLKNTLYKDFDYPLRVVFLKNTLYKDFD